MSKSKISNQPLQAISKPKVAMKLAKNEEKKQIVPIGRLITAEDRTKKNMNDIFTS